MQKRNFSSRTGLPWLVLAALGLAVGLSLFTFVYARGGSYFFDDPQACLNCHVMRDQFEAWNHSPHKQVANCNSCHTPKNLLAKYAVKGINGWNHSLAFTTGKFADPLRIRPFNRRIAIANCIRCHRELTSRMLYDAQGQPADCLSCHGNVGHSTRN
jgi:cytochrome c nitrite reductase small subunit